MVQDVVVVGCYFYDLVVWWLCGYICNDRGDLWICVVNYYLCMLLKNVIYCVDLMVKVDKWVKWLDVCFVIVNYGFSLLVQLVGKGIIFVVVDMLVVVLVEVQLMK